MKPDVTLIYTRSVSDPDNENSDIAGWTIHLKFTWAGGPYIDVADNSKGLIGEVIYASNLSLDFTQEAFENKCNNWVNEYGRDKLVYDVLMNW